MKQSGWIVAMLWISGASIGAVLVGALCLLYFDRRLASLLDADRQEALNEIRMAIATAGKRNERA